MYASNISLELLDKNDYLRTFFAAQMMQA